ncbi:hypothetical protein [Frondihabitans sp. PhB188]|nr:hypothetical protein [Frondihabitans sp. PhB188]
MHGRSRSTATEATAAMEQLLEHAWLRGRYEDIVLMGLLRSDWRPR